jgi:phosphatidylserine/phosphatidylglycerophosphate/cardiolipin synthase-like enzyme
LNLHIGKRVENTPFSHVTTHSGFGEHVYGPSSIEDIRKARAHKTRVLNFSIAAIAVASVVAALSGVGVIPIAIGIAACAIGATFLTVSFFKSALNYHKHVCRSAGIVRSSDITNAELQSSSSKNKRISCEAFPTEHCADTDLWRKELIKKAKHNIVISGNYCGGEPFDELLDLIEQRMKKNPELKAIVISSPKFIKNKKVGKVQFANIDKINKLQTQFPDQFSLIKSPDIWHISPGIKKATNHTKCTVIDYGRYFILGGSGIKENFVMTGQDGLTTEEFLLRQNSPNKELSNTDPTQTVKDDASPDKGFLSKFISGNFRDMDFVFHSPPRGEPAGKKIYREMLLLAHRWEQYNKVLKAPLIHLNKLKLNSLSDIPYKKIPALNDADSPLFDNHLIKEVDGDSAVTKLLKTRIPPPITITTTVHSFHKNPKIAKASEFDSIYSGPENSHSTYEKKLISHINKAEKEIKIAQMYFHPTTNLINSIIRAAERGVKITIISCGVYENCPNGHLFFGPRNKYNFWNLLNSLSPTAKHNVEIFEYQQYKKGYHKKVVIVDDYVIAGSSNMGYKSLVSTSDHEINFSLKSEKFARETSKILATDISLSHRVDPCLQLTLSERLFASWHKKGAFIWG